MSRHGWLEHPGPACRCLSARGQPSRALQPGFPAVEINSLLLPPAPPRTYARWAATVPAEFRFAVKLPKEITHTRRLADAEEPLARFLGRGRERLATKLGPLAGAAAAEAWPSSRVSPASSGSPAPLRRATSSASHGTGAGSATRPTPAAGSPHRARRRRSGRRARRSATLAAGQGYAISACMARPRMYYSAYPPETLDALAQRLSWTQAASVVHLRQHRRGCSHARRDDGHQQSCFRGGEESSGNSR